MIEMREMIEKEENIEKNQESFFTKKYTNIAKGIAVLLLLLHHLILDPELGIFKSSTILNVASQQSKVCVSIFLILSGYGLNTSLNKKEYTKNSDIIKFSLKHLFKLMISYWFIFIIFMFVGSTTGMRTLDLYGENKVLNICIDFFGLASLCSTPTYNATWWFMSLIIILYLMFPIFKNILKKSPLAFILIIISVRIFNIFKFYPVLNQYLDVFAMGMIFSEFKIFDKLRDLNKCKFDEIVVVLMFLLFSTYTRYKFGGIYDMIAAFAIIFVSNTIFSNIKIVNKTLELLGKHSGNIFMFHTFIYKYFFINLMAKLKYWILMYIVLVISTLIISIIIEQIKKLISVSSKKNRKYHSNEI